MHKVKAVIILSCLVAVGGAIATLFVPQNDGPLVGLGYHIFLAYPWIFTVLYLGALVVFLMGLKNFRTKPRFAYALICAGLLIMVLAQSQLGVITYLNAWTSSWVKYGMIMLPYLFGGLFVFMGIRLFSRLLGVRYLWNSWLFVMPLSVILISIAVFLPHPPATDNLPEPIYDMALGLMVWNAMFSTLATVVTLRVKQTISPVFTRAMAWLYVALIIHTFGAWQIAAFQIIGFQHWYNVLGFVILPFIISGVLLLRAGYAFNQASKY